MLLVRLSGVEFKLKDSSREAVDLISSAVEERLKTMVEKLSVIAQHRLEIYRVRIY